jgi:hypothetical protein
LRWPSRCPPRALSSSTSKARAATATTRPDDVALDAALLAAAPRAGRSRSVVARGRDSWAPFGPAMLVEIEADLGRGGRGRRNGEATSGATVTAPRPGAPRPPVARGIACRKWVRSAIAINAPLRHGGGAERNAEPPTTSPRDRILNHRVLAMRSHMALRSPERSQVFAMEASSTTGPPARRGPDRVAASTPGRSRARAVLEAAARSSGWRTRSKREGIGHGTATRSTRTRPALCAVVPPRSEAGARDSRAQAVDRCGRGLAINPGRGCEPDRGRRHPGGERALKEAVAFDRMRVTPLMVKLPDSALLRGRRGSGGSPPSPPAPAAPPPHPPPPPPPPPPPRPSVRATVRPASVDGGSHRQRRSRCARVPACRDLPSPPAPQTEPEPKPDPPLRGKDPKNPKLKPPLALSPAGGPSKSVPPRRPTPPRRRTRRLRF